MGITIYVTIGSQDGRAVLGVNICLRSRGRGGGPEFKTVPRQFFLRFIYWISFGLYTELNQIINT